MVWDLPNTTSSQTPQSKLCDLGQVTKVTKLP